MDETKLPTLEWVRVHGAARPTIRLTDHPEVMVRMRSDGFTLQLDRAEMRYNFGSLDSAKREAAKYVAEKLAFDATPALLPRSAESIKIGDMKPGEEGWCVPWGMYADEQGGLWLNSTYVLTHEPSAQSDLKVWRSKDDGGWYVDASLCRLQWKRGDLNYSAEFTPIPVTGAKFR